MDVLIWEGHGRGGGRFEWYALHSVLRIMYVRRNRAEAFVAVGAWWATAKTYAGFLIPHSIEEASL